MMEISNTISAVFQLTNEMSAKAAHTFMANLKCGCSHTLISGVIYACDGV